MKILFLDIDGVINSDEYANEYHKYKLGLQGYHIWVDPKAVERVRRLCEETGAKIILSSSWRSYRLDVTLEDLKRYDGLEPLLPYLVGVTPAYMSRCRGREIDNLFEEWSHHIEMGLIDKQYENEPIERYAIVDDDNDMLEKQLDHFVQTDWKYGITDDDVNKLKTILS